MIHYDFGLIVITWNIIMLLAKQQKARREKTCNWNREYHVARIIYVKIEEE